MPERVRQTVTNGPDQALFEDVLAEHIELSTSVARLNQKKKTNLGRYEAAGGDPDDIKYAHRMRNLDAGEARAKIRQRAKVDGWLGLVAFDAVGQGGFSKLFDGDVKIAKPVTPSSGKLEANKAMADGYNSGLAGGARDHNPHDAGTERHAKWDAGWLQGAEDHAAKTGEPAADTSKAKPAHAAKTEPAAEARTPRKRRAAPESKASDDSKLADANASDGNTDLRPGWQGDRDVTLPDGVTEFPVVARRPRRSAPDETMH